MDLARARARLAERVFEHGDDVPLDEGAALVAAEERGADPDALLRALDRLAEGLYVPHDAPAHEAVARLNLHLFQRHGFRGEVEAYDAPEASLLDVVLEVGRGLPILLSIVYAEVGRRAGVAIDPIGFPGHFLVSPRGTEPRFYVDPFHLGRVLLRDMLEERLGRIPQVVASDREAYLGPLPNRHVLYRVSNNLRQVWLQRGDEAGALRAVERMILLGPEQVGNRRDRGLLLARLGRAEEARAAFADYLEHAPDAPDAERVHAWLRNLG